MFLSAAGLGVVLEKRACGFVWRAETNPPTNWTFDLGALANTTLLANTSSWNYSLGVCGEAADVWSFGVLLADAGYFAGMRVPREVRVYLETLAKENRAAAAVKLEAARAALAAESGRATYANPAFEG